MKLIVLLLLSSFIYVNLPKSFEGYIVYENIDARNGRDTMIEYYSQKKMLTEYKGNNAILKHLIVVEWNGILSNYIQTRNSKKWTKFSLQTTNIDRPVFFNTNDSMLILNNICRAIEFKTTTTSNQSVTIMKSIKSYLSDSIFFFLTPDSNDALNRIQLFREVKISSTNGAYDNIIKRTAIKIVQETQDDSLFMVPKDYEENTYKK